MNELTGRSGGGGGGASLRGGGATTATTNAAVSTKRGRIPLQLRNLLTKTLIYSRERAQKVVEGTIFQLCMVNPTIFHGSTVGMLE